MAKKRTGTPSDEPAPLKHNPFAKLAGAAPARPEPPPADARASTPSEGVPSAERAASTCPAAPAPAKAGARGRVVLRRETKHRGGKAVVIVSGLAQLKDHDEAATLALAQKLKKQLGCGGTVETTAGQREIVLQGDRPAQVAELLRAMGFRVDGVTS